MGVQREMRVTLDVRRARREPVATAVFRQHDMGARILLDVQDGGAALPQAGLTAHLMCDTRGGLVEAELVAQGGAWVYTVGRDLTAYPGRLAPYVELRRGGEVIAATGCFEVLVDRAADLTAPQAEAAQSRLDDAVGAWGELSAAAGEAEAARREAEAARVLAEGDRREAERARDEAESRRDGEERSRASAEAKRSQAEAARNDAERERAAEWEGVSFAVGDVSAGELAGAGCREGPGGRLDVLLDLTLPKGDKGEPGDAGFQGPIGPQGVQGPQGDVGPQGLPGAAGPAGPQGAVGPTGPQGARGDTGPQGPEGPTGPTGEPGPAGPAGVRGPQGEAGPDGPQGPQGDAGPRGPQGERGPAGPQGARGERGERGEAGESGVVAPLSGMFVLSVDADGDLWATVADGAGAPPLEYDPETGDLYFEIG